MSRKPRSLKQAQSQLSQQMRRDGSSWAQIGQEFQRRYRVNARVALRQARGWTQPEAAERWNRRWPEDPKTFKNFSYWEAWPSSTGYAPSLDVLDRMAQLYECSIADLVSDLDDYGAPKKALLSNIRERAFAEPVRPATPNTASSASPAMLPEALDAEAGGLFTSVPDISSLITTPEDGNSLSRRAALLNLSSVLAVAAAAPLVTGKAAPEALERVDPAMIKNTGLIVGGLRQQNAALGPSSTLQTGLAMRAMMESVVKDAPGGLTERAWVVYGDLAQLLGWMMFNLGQDEAARFYYEDARKAAYQADDYELAANVLAAQAHLSMTAGDHQAAVDHAQAAEEAAKRSSSRHARAYAADMAARTYAAAGQGARSLAALERERRNMQRIDWSEPAAERWGFFGPAFYWARESECHLLLGHPVEAADAGREAQQRFNPAYLHNNAMTLARKAEALSLYGDYPSACKALAEASRMGILAGSPRLTKQMRAARDSLAEYESEPIVQALDARMATYRQQQGATTAAGSLPGPAVQT